jgi:hypothetical protein
MAINKTGSTILRYDGNIVRYFSQTALIGSVSADTSKWYGITPAANGKLYCAPLDSTQVLEIDQRTALVCVEITLITSVYIATF